MKSLPAPDRRFSAVNGRGRRAGGHAQISLFGVRIKTCSARCTWMAALRSGRLNGPRLRRCGEVQGSGLWDRRLRSPRRESAGLAERGKEGLAATSVAQPVPGRSFLAYPGVLAGHVAGPCQAGLVGEDDGLDAITQAKLGHGVGEVS